MRVLPRRWDAETLVCAARGHRAPAARVRHLRPDDTPVGIELGGGGGRLSRCLRCDLWLRTAEPAAADVEADELPPLDQLPVPRRGKALEDAIVTRAIALERVFHSALFTLAAVVLVIVDLDLGGLRSSARSWSDSLQGMVANSARGGSHEWLVRHLDDVGTLRLDAVRLLLLLAVAYAVIGGAEAWGLWHERRWAEYLTVVETGLLLPLELHELTERVTVVRLAMLALNLAVLGWLVWNKRLFGVRGGGQALHRAPPDRLSLGAPAPPLGDARC